MPKTREFHRISRAPGHCPRQGHSGYGVGKASGPDARAWRRATIRDLELEHFPEKWFSAENATKHEQPPREAASEYRRSLGFQLQ
jgi:hypothetical protein